MPSMEQAETFLPPAAPFSSCIPSSTHPSQAIKLLVMSKLPKSKKDKDAKATKPQIMQAGDSNSGECTWKTFRNKVVYAEPLQNATSRRILSMYYQQQPPTNVPVDVRSGLDVRTLAPAQDPNYLVPKLANTFDTNVKSSVKPFYEGGLLNRLRHGFGKCCFRNAAFTYEGEWAHGNFQGQGKLQLPDGVYEGDFRNGEITGSGMRCWNDGTQYTGEFLDGEMHGQGLFLRADGERYEGGFVRNQRSGSGVLVTPDGTCYEGFFEEHRLNGHGSYEGISGDRYQGDWCNGNMDGVGEYWYANGDHYIGRFARNLREGKGAMFFAASGIKLECDWDRDLPLILPARITAEYPDRLFWVPPPRPPSLKQVVEGEEEDAQGEEEEEWEPPEPPPSLKDAEAGGFKLAAPLPPGSLLPPFYITVEGTQGAGHQVCPAPARPRTPGGGLDHTQPQLGESGRLLFLTFGVFEREAAPEVSESQDPAVTPPLKTFPQTAFAIDYEPAESATRSNGSCSQAESLGSQEGLVGEESGVGARLEESWREGEDNVTGVGEGEEDGATALRKFLARGTPWPFKKTYPPPSVISGIKASEGRVLIQGLRLKEDLACGTYHLRIGSSYELPWGEPVEAAYLEITVANP